MVVYIEYVFLENFFYDGVLLALSLFACKEKIRWGRLLVSAALGGVFAVVYPLLELPNFLAFLLKTAVGISLTGLLFKRIKSGLERRKFLLTTLVFFALSATLAGAVTGLANGVFSSKIPRFFVFFVFLSCGILTVILVKTFYQKRRLHAFIYECKVRRKEKEFLVLGYLDSGNRARKNGLPVCFLSPDVYCGLFADEWLNNGENETEMLVISTMAGEKNIRLGKGEIELFSGNKRIKKEVYFALSRNMINREYKALLSAYFGEEACK